MIWLIRIIVYDVFFIGVEYACDEAVSIRNIKSARVASIAFLFLEILQFMGTGTKAHQKAN